MTDTTQAAGLIERLKAQAAAHRYMAETDSAQLIDEAVAALAAQSAPTARLLASRADEELKRAEHYKERALKAEAALVAQAVPADFKWPRPPKRGQSSALFDDGYDEGWAKCIDTLKAMLAASPAPAEAKEEPTIPDSFFRGMDADYRKEAWRIRSKIKNGLAAPQPQGGE